MKVCIPIDVEKGLQSPVCAHFGSAPAFLVVDTDTGAYHAVTNANQHHGHGMCKPLQSLHGERIDAMAVGGIGMGALTKLRAASIRVYLSSQATAAETVAAFKAGTLQEMQPGMACAGQDHP